MAQVLYVPRKEWNYLDQRNQFNQLGIVPLDTSTRPRVVPNVPITTYPSTTTYPTATTFPTQTQSGGGSNVQGYFNTVASLVSQWLTAYGRNPTTQLSPSGQITGIANPNLLAAYNAQTTQALATTQQPNYQNNSTVGGSLGSGLDGIINWAVSNPVYVFLGIAGIYLLFREPPRRR